MKVKYPLFLKIIILCVGLVLFTALALYFIANNQSEKSIEKQISLNLKNQSTYIFNNIDRFIFERLSDVKHFATDPILSNLDSDQKTIRQRLIKFKAENPLYESLSFFDTSRVRLADTKNLAIGKQHSYSKYWLQLSQKDWAIDISLSESLKQAVIHFAQNVIDENGNFIGVVVSRVLISKLYAVFDDMTDQTSLGQELLIDLLDKNGIVLYSNTTPKKVLKDKYTNLSIILKHIKNNKAQKYNYFTEQGNIYLYSYEKGYLNYAGSNWLLVLSIPESIAYKPSRTLRYNLYLSFVPILIIAIVLALIFSRYLARPIVQLSRLAHEYGKGNFEASIDFKFGDERQLLAGRMATMAKQIKGKMTEQKQLNKELEKKVKKIEKQKNKIESQKDLITSSLDYAQRIQKAMLPNLEDMQNDKLDFFIIHQPLHIVSGDFYWIDTIENIKGEKEIIFAAIDCTGHGVPGAFMSIMADNLLKQIIILDEILMPSQILQELNKRVKHTLKQNIQSESGISDGMDIALSIINLHTGLMRFAGAHRPLFLFRKGELIQKKGERWSVGGNYNYFDTVKKQFHDNYNPSDFEIQLQENDTIYLFTDGFTDQFGGKDNKKYSIGKLKKTLAITQDLPLQAQKPHLEEEFRVWKGNFEQTDDMLLLGIKFL